MDHPGKEITSWLYIIYNNVCTVASYMQLATGYIPP